MSTRLQQRKIAVTASFTIVAPLHQPGLMFTNRGAGGAVTFTLPKPSLAVNGWWYEFLGVADQNIIVDAGVGNGIALNNAACRSLAMQTGGQRIGAGIMAQCDGTSWILTGMTQGVTYTIA